MRLLHLSVLALVAGGLVVPFSGVPTAAASAACSFQDGIVRVVLPAEGTATVSVGAGGEILVDGAQCDVATVADTIGVEVWGRRGSERLTLDVLDPPATAPDGRRLTFRIVMGAGTDVLAVTGSAGPDFVSLSVKGIKLADTPLRRRQDVVPTGVETFVADGGGGDDMLGVAPESAAAPIGRLVLRGGGGADALAGGSGPDALLGGSGIDRLVGGAGADRADGGTENDRILGGAGRDVATGEGGSDSLAGGPDADRLAGEAEGDAIAGGPGADSLLGGADDDELLGDDGTDRLAGGPGVDDVSGGGARDVAAGGTDGDRLFGGTDADRLAGGAGVDAITAGPGEDTVLGGGDRDELIGGDGRDRLAGGDGADKVSGGPGRDLADGGGRDDRLAGGPDDDYLRGVGGRDLLLGENGSDVLAGGPGLDTCRQGNGKGRSSSCENPPPPPPLPLTPERRIMVVSQNLKEVHTHVADDIFPAFGDQERSLELWNFARRLSNILGHTPDVLLLQEVSRSAAEKTAAKLSDRFRVPYRAVVKPQRSLWVRLLVSGGTFDGVDVYKKNTAIVINARTMEYRRGGYLATPQLERDRDEDGIRTIQHQAHALIREKKSGVAMSAMSIHFNSNNFFASPELGEIRRTRWTELVATFARREYPHLASRLIGGEFCQRRCQDGGLEYVDCEEKRFWKILTQDFGYRDAVFVANRTSDEDLAEQATSRDGKPMRIDYLFARPSVLNASRDITYTADEGDKNYIADHRGNWSLGELRR